MTHAANSQTSLKWTVDCIHSDPNIASPADQSLSMDSPADPRTGGGSNSSSVSAPTLVYNAPAGDLRLVGDATPIMSHLNESLTITLDGSDHDQTDAVDGLLLPLLYSGLRSLTPRENNDAIKTPEPNRPLGEAAQIWEDLDNELFQYNSTKLFVEVDYAEVNSQENRSDAVSRAKTIAQDLYGMTLREWQAGIPFDLSKGRDTMCVMGTGQGKTMVAVTYAIMNPKSCILFVSPLVALMESQVAKFSSQGVRSICLTADYIESKPEIWTDVKNGKYQVVICAPEVVSSRNGTFWRRVASQPTYFKHNCSLIIIDEAHLIWGWQTFRPDFCSLGTLRANFPRSAICAMSATMPPHIRSFVHKTLHLQTPTLLCKETIDRKNITIAVAPLLDTKNPLTEFAEFIREKDSVIIPTIVYLDNRQDCKELAVRNRMLLKDPKLKDNALQVIRPFSSACSAEYQAETIRLVRDGICRIIYATASASNGIDFPGIWHIVQYGLDAKTIDFCSFYQRSGRAGRDTNEDCVSIIFSPLKYILPRLPIGGDLEEGFGKFRSPIQRPRDDMMKELYAQPYSKKKKPTTAQSQQRKKKTQAESMLDLDPMLLWFINTSGCRRQLALAYFDDPVRGIDDIDSEYVCCDVCNGSRDSEIAGTSLTSSLTNYFAVKAQPHRPAKRGAITSATHKEEAYKRIKTWRDTLWRDTSIFSMNEYAPPSALIADDKLMKFASHAARIESVDDMTRIFGEGWNSSVLKTHVPGLLQLLVDLNTEVSMQKKIAKANAKKPTIHGTSGLTDIPDRTWMILDPIRREQARAQRLESILRLEAHEELIQSTQSAREAKSQQDFAEMLKQKQQSADSAKQRRCDKEIAEQIIRMKSDIAAYNARLLLGEVPFLGEVPLSIPVPLYIPEIQMAKPPNKKPRTTRKTTTTTDLGEQDLGEQTCPKPTRHPPSTPRRRKGVTNRVPLASVDINTQQV